MNLKGGYRRIASVLAIVSLAILCASYLARDAIFLHLIRPGDSAAKSIQAARAEDRAEIVWLRRPETPPAGAWETPWGVDVFFVHPTTAIWPSKSWIASSAREGDQDATQRALQLYGDGLGDAAALYAPGYRQAVLQAMLGNDKNGQAALEFAYQDVLEAFDAYVSNDNRYRAIVLVGVEQGALHVARLLSDRFSDGPLRDRLGAAYLIDLAIDERDLPVPVCQTSDDTGCAVAWVQEGRAPKVEASEFIAQTTQNSAASGSTSPICVNPLSWRTDQALAPAADHLGGVARLDRNGDPAIVAQAVSTRCADGVLSVEGAPSSLRGNRWWGWGHQYVPAERNLFYADMASNVATRARAISAKLDAIGRKPAKPLPPVNVLDEAPIHRPDGETAPVQ